MVTASTSGKFKSLLCLKLTSLKLNDNCLEIALLTVCSFWRPLLCPLRRYGCLHCLDHYLDFWSVTAMVTHLSGVMVFFSL